MNRALTGQECMWKAIMCDSVCVCTDIINDDLVNSLRIHAIIITLCSGYMQANATTARIFIILLAMLLQLSFLINII